jgi:DNA-binding MarR family transcriptional regulator
MGTHVRVANGPVLAHSSSTPLSDSSRISRVLQPFCLSLPQFRALEILNQEREPQPQTVLKDKLGITHDGSVLLAVSLHDRGFIVRRTAPEYPHPATLQITDLGRTILESAMFLVYHCSRKVAASFRDS